MKKTAVVVCPGRGTYNKDELGYLQRYHSDKSEFIDSIDAYREAKGQVSIRSLDEAGKYNMRTHTAGENASALIYACAYGDFVDIDTEQYDVVAVTGNSMGWYIALACAGALSPEQGTDVINTMGSMMEKGIIGGQIIYPVMADNWQIAGEKVKLVEQVIDEVNQQADAELYVSIKLGGYYVLGGNEVGLGMAMEHLPQIEERYPMRLFNHAAFHTPMLTGVSQTAKQILPIASFSRPNIPLVDGRGQIWQPHSTDVSALFDYTLGHQVDQYYDFSKAIEVACKEFAPDCLIILGPGATLGGATAQSLINANLCQLDDKDSFIQRQKQDPVILSMGMPEQRGVVTGK